MQYLHFVNFHIQGIMPIVFAGRLVEQLWRCEGLKFSQISVPQIEYPLGGSSKKGSHVYFLLIVAMVLLELWHQIVLLWHHSITQKTCNRKYTWLPLCYCPLVSILFEVLRIESAFILSHYFDIRYKLVLLTNE